MLGFDETQRHFCLRVGTNICMEELKAGELLLFQLVFHRQPVLNGCLQTHAPWKFARPCTSYHMATMSLVGRFASARCIRPWLARRRNSGCFTTDLFIPKRPTRKAAVMESGVQNNLQLDSSTLHSIFRRFFFWPFVSSPCAAIVRAPAHPARSHRHTVHSRRLHCCLAFPLSPSSAPSVLSAQERMFLLLPCYESSLLASSHSRCAHSKSSNCYAQNAFTLALCLSPCIPLTVKAFNTRNLLLKLSILA